MDFKNIPSGWLVFGFELEEEEEEDRIGDAGLRVKLTDSHSY